MVAPFDLAYSPFRPRELLLSLSNIAASFDLA